MRILLAEDNPHHGARVQLLLEVAGHEVVRVDTGDEAFARFASTPFPVVVADLEAPGLNGYELCRRIRTRDLTEYVYFILLVPQGSEFHFEKAKDADVDDVLPIPVDPEIFRARLRVAERMLTLYGELDRLCGLIPICAYCKRIRQEQGLWKQMEAYISEHSHALFSHTVCPACAEIEFGDVMRARRQKLEAEARDAAGTEPPPGSPPDR